MKARAFKVFVLSIFFIFSFSLSLLNSQGTADFGKVVGAWEIELDVEGEYYYLSMKIEESEGKLKGTISEASGFFSDIPLTNIEYDGKIFNFDFNATTPPDGMERLLKMELEVGDNKLEGILDVPDLGVSGAVVATREKEY